MEYDLQTTMNYYDGQNLIELIECCFFNLVLFLFNSLTLAKGKVSLQRKSAKS